MKGRITRKKLVEWLNEKFKQFEILNYVVTDVSQTYFNNDQIEAGAARLIITFEHVDPTINVFGGKYFYCFYSIKQLQYHCDNGYELYLKINGRLNFLTDLKLDVRKINTV